MKKTLFLVILIILIIVLGVGFLAWKYELNKESITEDIGNALEKKDLIQATEPLPNTVIQSPLIIKGQAQGTWFFEASFPVKLLDANGTVIASSIATTSADWMTTDFIPFQAQIEFQKPATEKGTLILEKDNPSGLPQNADKLIIPVSF